MARKLKQEEKMRKRLQRREAKKAGLTQEEEEVGLPPGSSAD